MMLSSHRMPTILSGMEERIMGVLDDTHQPHYNTPQYNAVFNISLPCHGSQIDNFAVCLQLVISY